jgi:phage nucleotide-binding protein
MLIYGMPFSGKTTFADSSPNPLMLNTDGNAEYVTAPYVSIQDEVTVMGRITKRKFAWEVFKEYIEELEKGGNDFQTIVVDLVNDTYEMCRLYMYDKLGITHESDDTYKAWDKVRTEYLSTMRRVMHLPYENIILLAHEDATKNLTKKNGESFTSIKPKIMDKVADALSGMVGFVGRAYVDDGKYLLSIKSDEIIYGGGRLGASNVEVPLDWDEVTKLFEIKN